MVASGVCPKKKAQHTSCNRCLFSFPFETEVPKNKNSREAKYVIP